MEFGIPPSTGENYPRHIPPLRAEGNLSYLEFIALVQSMWAEAHPDIPIKPAQSATFTKYPVIIYALETRKPMNVESKKRYRDQIYRKDEDTNLIISAQRFENVISFEVRTQNNPEMAEAIIEVFEEFMDEYTGVFKRLGVSDIFYLRRAPDDDETRRDSDVDVRAVAYMVIIERIIVTEERRLEELVVRARTMLKNEGAAFYVMDDADDFITIVHHNFQDADFIQLHPPSEGQTHPTDGSIPTEFPSGLSPNVYYQITNIDGSKLYLSYLDGTPAPPTAKGMGRFKQVSIPYGNIEIEDNQQEPPPIA